MLMFYLLVSSGRYEAPVRCRNGGHLTNGVNSAPLRADCGKSGRSLRTVVMNNLYELVSNCRILGWAVGPPTRNLPLERVTAGIS